MNLPINPIQYIKIKLNGFLFRIYYKSLDETISVNEEEQKTIDSKIVISHD